MSFIVYAQTSFVVYALLNVHKRFNTIELLLYAKSSIISYITFVIYALLSMRKRFEVFVIYKAITIYTYCAFVIKQ